MNDRIYFEDLVPGQVYDLGSKQVSKEEVIEFASEFDPQPFHLDEDAGNASILGALSASGWHTASMVMGLLARGFLNKSSCQGSPGVNKLGWRKPVFPGDTLHAQAKVVEQRELKSKPDLGLVMFEISAVNQDGTEVLNQVNPILFGKKSAAPEVAKA